MEWEQQELLEQDRLTVEIHLSYLHGWEWAVRHWDGHTWGVVDSGTGKSTQDAIAATAGALLELAHGWEF